MSNVFHKDFTLDNNHVVHAFSYADQAAREAATGLASADVGKIARQEDDGSFWILLDDVLVTWAEVSDDSVAGEDTQVQFNDDGDLAGDPGFTYDKDADDLTVALLNGAPIGLDAAGNLYVGGAIPGTIGNKNIAIGKDALANIDDAGAERNTVLGMEAGHDITSGQTNTLIGYQSGDKITTGSQNVALGLATLGALLDGFGNVVVGHSAGPLLTGSKNVILGRGAAPLFAVGGSNLLIGDGSAPTLEDGTGNIILGTDADVPAASVNNFLNLAGLLFGDLNNGFVCIGGDLAKPAGPEILRVEGDTFLNGDLGVGLSSPARMVHIQGGGAVIRIDRDTDSPALQLHRFPSGDFTTPWKGFLFGVTASGVNDGEFYINDFGTAVSGGGALRRFTIDTDGNIVIPGNVGIGNDAAPGAVNLLIQSDDAVNPVIARIYNSNASGYARIYVGAAGGNHVGLLTNSTNGTVLGIPAGKGGIVADYGDMYFAVGLSGTAEQKMRLGTDGVLTLLGMFVLDGGLYCSYDATNKKIMMIPADRRNRFGGNTIAIGDLLASTEGSSDSGDNVFLGMNSWLGVLSSMHNVCIGANQAGRMRIGTDYNVFIGSQTVESMNLQSRFNVVIGALAAADPANIDENVIVGALAARDTSTVERNVILGYRAAQASNLVEDSVILGYDCVKNFTSAKRCIFIGSSLGKTGTHEDLLDIGGLLMGDLADGTAVLAGVELYRDGSGNLWLGGEVWAAWAGPGSGNIFIGYHDTCGLVEGDGNVLLGARCGLGLSGGAGEHYDNIMLGSLVAANTNTGDGNVLIGANVECPTGHWDNALNINELIFGRGRMSGSTRVRIGGAAGDGLTESAVLELDGSDGAFLLPRMTTTERNALANKVDGMVIYNSTLNQFQGREASNWVNL